MSKRRVFWLLAVIGAVLFTMVPASAQELPPPTGEEWCASTQGFWKNHPEEWPAFTDIGIGLWYFQGKTQADLIALLKTPVAKYADPMELILIKQLIAAQLNVLKAPSLAFYTVDGQTVADLIQQADEALLNGFSDWLDVEAIKNKLDTFNNSETCASGGGGGDIPA